MTTQTQTAAPPIDESFLLRVRAVVNGFIVSIDRDGDGDEREYVGISLYEAMNKIMEKEIGLSLHRTARAGPSVRPSNGSRSERSLRRLESRFRVWVRAFGSSEWVDGDRLAPVWKLKNGQVRNVLIRMMKAGWVESQTRNGKRWSEVISP